GQSGSWPQIRLGSEMTASEPAFWLLHPESHKQSHECWDNAHDENRPPATVAQQEVDEGGQEEANRPSRLQESGRFRALVPRPYLGHQGSPGSPLATDSQRGQEAEKAELPPGGRESGQAREQRIDQDGEDQRFGPSEAIGQQSEHHAAHRPTHKEDRE